MARRRAAWHVLWSGGNDIPAALETSAVGGRHRRWPRVSSDASSLWVRYSAWAVAGAERFIVPNPPAFWPDPGHGIVHRAGGDQRPAHPGGHSVQQTGGHWRGTTGAVQRRHADAASQQALRRKALNAAGVLGLPANTW